jgi:hypothetical protein
MLVAHPENQHVFEGLCALGLLLGVLLVLPIGGADMPVVVALLNSYSGLASCATGFAIGNVILIISGSLDGASGFILSILMSKAMNRSFTNVLFGAFGSETAIGPGKTATGLSVRAISVEDAAMLHRFQDRGEPMVLTLRMGARTLPDAPSRNVIGEIMGLGDAEREGQKRQDADRCQGQRDEGPSSPVPTELFRNFHPANSSLWLSAEKEPALTDTAPMSVSLSIPGIAGHQTTEQYAPTDGTTLRTFSRLRENSLHRFRRRERGPTA